MTQLDAIAFFSARLRFQTDVADVHAALESATPGLVVIDSRGDAAWSTGRVPGAVHLPTALIEARAGELIVRDARVVTYCWGPGCNGATRAAAAFARQGYDVAEMLGGIEYWTREGFPVETDHGLRRRAADPLTAPPDASCAC
ncbi:rhodanese-like domain-containing protein [Stackebrandtia soli]|uniref:rhodanese-like domain-containing protein n=1 Tax=Stackebrandtia soli TaxID=1892856 RepID=UPI0039EAF771